MSMSMSTRNLHPSPLTNTEATSRTQELHNPVILLFINLYASFKTFAKYLISLSSLLSIALSASCTIYAYYATEEKGDAYDGGSMDWFLLGFAVITPMTMSIGFAFRRREEALKDIARFKSITYQIYLGHSTWSWKMKNADVRTESNEEDKNFYLQHADYVLRLLLECADELFHFLTLPTMSRARHRVTKVGKREATVTVNAAYELFHSFYSEKFVKITQCTEVLKIRGLPANEASRIRQWEQLAGESVEHLRMLKMYRTPQALRSFARIFSLLLPPFYAPAFAQLSHDTGSLALGVAFAVIISLALTAIFNSVLILEDPFVGHITLDGIDVREELVVLHWDQLIAARNSIFPDAPSFICNNKDSTSTCIRNRTTSYASLIGATPEVEDNSVVESIHRFEE